MKFRNDSFLLKIILGMLAAWLFLSLEGCATPLSEEYWQERYANMTDEELEVAKDGSGEMVSVCNLSDCIFVWVD